MITVSDLSLNFSGTNLFSNVNIKFIPGNCYGIIGANGAGKTTFLNILSGEIEPSTGDVFIPEHIRMSVLKQDHYAYDEFSVLDTIMMGNQRLYAIMKEKDALYMKEDFSDADGIKAGELEGEFAEMGGWEAESDASRIIQGLGLSADILDNTMNVLNGNEKVKVLLAQALFGKPEIILLDEPTNHLDIQAVLWLEDFLMDYEGTVIVVSHDRYFLNNVCTHIVDIDYNKIKVYVGNYDFWYESSQLIQRLLKDQNKKSEDKAKELQNFIARFSANKSKSKQATSRKKMLDKLNIEDMPSSSRKYPWVGFQIDREPGKEILSVEHLSKTIDGVKVLNNVSFRVSKEDKIAFVSDNEIAMTTLFKILMEEIEPDEGSFKWGVSTGQSYFPKDNGEFFNDCTLNVCEWIQQYTEEITETYIRGFLGRMLFSGDDIYKEVQVLSGGERVRCMLSKMMMNESNVLVMDQPTNHLDLESITAVNNGLMEFKGILLFASHDHQFMQTVANRIIEVREEGTLDRLSTYDEFIDYKKTLA
ncbi:MAG: ABC-F family ATP-binding cassette domain-containing protein [Eubacteriaceae bacterium]|nr:ABC-F family ATP-binding cassette domain-containing protein [Eubacteriaceae bacterium]